MLYAPKKVMGDVEKIFVDFIWPRIKHNVRKKSTNFKVLKMEG